MKFQIDHDYHIHSQLSSCSNDPEQTPERILQYAKENGFRRICLTNHFWDETVPGASKWYQPQNFAHLKKALPLPQRADIAFYFGCETDMDRFFTLGISRQTIDRFDFVIVPTTHMHMTGFTREEGDAALPRLAELYVKRLEALLAMDLPFGKMGLAHPTTPQLAPQRFEDHLRVLDMLGDAVFIRLFTLMSKKGMGVELNIPIFRYAPEDLDRLLRPYRIAKDCGCKFYLGSDAHHPKDLDAARDKFERIVSLLALEKSDQFCPFDA